MCVAADVEMLNLCFYLEERFTALKNTAKKEMNVVTYRITNRTQIIKTNTTFYII